MGLLSCSMGSYNMGLLSCSMGSYNLTH